MYKHDYPYKTLCQFLQIQLQFTKLLLLLLLLSRYNCVRLCATPGMAAHQAPPSLGFSRQEHWSGLPFPSPMHESGKWKWSRSVVSDYEYRCSNIIGTLLQFFWTYTQKYHNPRSGIDASNGSSIFLILTSVFI